MKNFVLLCRVCGCVYLSRYSSYVRLWTRLEEESMVEFKLKLPGLTTYELCTPC